MKRRTFFAWISLGWLASIFPWLVSSFVSQVKRPQKVVAQSDKSQGITFYIAPNGKDSWSGQLANTNGTETDGPFATLERVRNAIRQLKRQQGGSLKQPVTVTIRGGTYFLTKPLELFSEDSGTEKTPITYTAYEDETPVISGGRLIKGWEQETVTGKAMWTVTLPEVKDGKWYFQHLWVNGKRRNRARYPNTGYLKIESVPDAGQNWSKGVNNFRYRNSDLQAWSSANRGEAVVMTRWVESRLPIASIDESQRLIRFSKQSVFRLEPDDLYYLENIFEVLDTPGEWYLNRETGKLYYIPMPGENISNVEVIAPTLEYLALLRSDLKRGRSVRYINFNKLTFSHTDWQLPPQASGFAQNALGVPGAIFGVGVKYCNWKQCTMSHIGTHAIELFRGCQYNSIVECEMLDLGAGGIKLGERAPSVPKIALEEETHHNEILKNHIYDGGRFFPSAVGIRAVHTNNNLIAQNHIHDFYYMGISVRGVSGYLNPSQTNRAYNNTVEFNHIHHIGKFSNEEGPILNDKGGIYTTGLQPGTIIRSNIIHDIDAYSYGGWGIYLDNGSSQITVENNLVYRTRDGSLHHHYGKENTIVNNIFAFGKLAQIRRSQNENHLSFTFENNIVYWDTGKLLEGKWNDYNYFFDRNLYWQVGGGEILFNGLSWNEWQARGMDKNSLISEPEFADPEEGDFELQPDSPAFELGFQAIQARLMMEK
jgi:parallel beta-helix repeat protein